MPFAAALLGHGILLTHGNRDVVGDIAQLLDSGRDFLDGLNRSWRRLFDRHDVPRDFLGGLAGLWGKAFDLLGHHRETTAGFAGTRGLYCRVEGKQICAAMQLMRSLTSPIRRRDDTRTSCRYSSATRWRM